MSDCSLNGVGYDFAEDAEGDHFVLNGEPLRPPNAVVVQGTGRQDEFQARPDILLWNITDWSGGEGQIVFDPQAHNRHAILQQVDPFERPGILAPGYTIEDTEDSGASVLNVAGPRLCLFLDKTSTPTQALALFNYSTLEWWIWFPSGDYWIKQSNYTGPSSGAWSVVADEDQFYLGIYGQTQIYTLSYSGGAASSLVAATIADNNEDTDLALMGDYLYQIYWGGFAVYEINKSTGAVSTIDSASPATNGMTNSTNNISRRKLVAPGPNRLYVALPEASGRTTIREVVPTSANGPGYGKEIASYPNFVATSIWYHQGTLFIAGVDDIFNGEERVLLYLVPGGAYGALGRPRTQEEDGLSGYIIGNSEVNFLEKTHFVLECPDAGKYSRVYAINALTGGYAEIGRAPVAAKNAGPPIQFGKDIFFARSPEAAVAGGVFRLNHETYSSTAVAITPWHDMGLSDQKILSSLVLSCEALPADWEIALYYAKDGSSSYTLVDTYSTTSGTGTRYQVSDDSSTVLFRTLRIKIVATYTGGGTPTTGPGIHGVEVRAQVAQPVPVWHLLLDLSDDHDGGSQSFTGAQKITNIKAAAATKAVIDYTDHYFNRTPGSSASYDVLIDSYKITLDRPGEGVAEVVLREVV